MSLAVLSVFGCGGGDGGGGGDSQQPPPTAPPVQGLTSISFRLPDNTLGVAVTDPSSSTLGQLYATPNASDQHVLNAMSVETPNASYSAAFDASGKLTKISDTRLGNEVRVSTFPDRIEYRVYDTSNQFIAGAVVRVLGNSLIAGRLLRETYTSPTDLADETDVTSAVQQELSRLTAPPMTSRIYRFLFASTPIRFARAADPIDQFGNDLVVTIGSEILVAGWLPLAAALVVLGLGSPAWAAAAVGLFLFILLNAKKASANPLPPSNVFDGTYTNTHEPTIHFHSETDVVSGNSVSGNVVASSGSITWHGTVINVHTVGNQTKATIVGQGTTFLPDGTSHSWTLRNAGLEINPLAAALFWNGGYTRAGPCCGFFSRRM
jgi:hypothetical protein